jgi:hypothetical protein
MVSFSQKKVINKFETQLEEIEISTVGLDDFVLENSESEFIEIYVYAENLNAQHIVFNETKSSAKISFKIAQFLKKEIEIHKPITERLKRAHAIVKIPKGKKVLIFGENINIASKNYKGNLAIFIEKGILKLHKIQANTTLNLYAGTVFATLKNMNMKVISNIGKIEIDGILFDKKYQKTTKSFKNNFFVNSIKANIFITSVNTK